MADYDSSLPVRTENPADVAATIVDSTGANNWSIDSNNIGQVNLNDGTNALSISTNGGITTVVTDGTDTIAIDSNGYLGNVIWDAAGAHSWVIDTTGHGAIEVYDGGNKLAIDQNSGSAYVAIVDSDGDMAQVTTSGQLHTVIYDGAGTNSWVVDGNGIGQVNLNDGTDALDINTDGSINVNVVQSTVGDDIHVYDTTASAVPATPETVIDYTVTTAKTLLLKSYYAACSGKAKFELKTGPSASELTKHVGFLSTSSGQAEVTFPQPIEVVAGDKVLVIVTNMDKQNADVYAAINGAEV